MSATAEVLRRGTNRIGVAVRYLLAVALGALTPLLAFVVAAALNGGAALRLAGAAGVIVTGAVSIRELDRGWGAFARFAAVVGLGLVVAHLCLGVLGG
ncbi:MAG TPA: hypothetical protein VHL53_23920 [Acidimicrobiia bacterium]|nr:hypothetical protein [Acidimicrobiia bacterium]